jgi:release factor glutamine methyltransferase
MAAPAILHQVWASARDRLVRADIPDASLEAEVLLRHALGIDRVAFYANLRDPVPVESSGRFDALLVRREGREPLAYITGKREFYGMDFLVTPDVLVPRQETELLVDLAIQRLDDTKTPRVLDVGTGTGCVALAIAAQVPDADVHSVDASDDALTVATRNRDAHGLAGRVTLHRGDLLSPFVGDTPRWDVIVSNPPYIPTDVIATLSPEVRAEPHMALDGGPDGLDPTRELLAQSVGLLADGGRLLIEIYSDSAAEAQRLAAAAFPDTLVSIHSDLLGLARVLEIGPVSGRSTESS